MREKAFADVDGVAGLKAEQIEGWLAQRYDNHVELPPDIRQRLLPLTLQTGQVQRSELYRDAQGGIHLDYIVPLKPNGAQAAAGVLLHTPIAQFLFPLIQRRPTPSPSAETMLVRREGDQVLYLNELRHQQQTALSLRIPLNTPNSPSAMALRAGKARHMETWDRQGNAVLAASRPIAGTSWFVVAKIDRDEVLASLRRLSIGAHPGFYGVGGRSGKIRATGFFTRSGLRFISRLLQGYLFDKPVSPDAFISLLQTTLTIN